MNYHKKNFNSNEETKSNIILTENDKTLFIHKASFNSYIARCRKYREKVKVFKSKSECFAGSGKLYHKNPRMTVPREFIFYSGSPEKYKKMNTSDISSLILNNFLTTEYGSVTSRSNEDDNNKSNIKV